jgi:hypothetical protein
MGVDYHVHFGPFVRVFNPKQPASESITACFNSQCTEFRKVAFSKFCAFCGNPISKGDVPKMERVKFDYYEELEECLVPSIYYKPEGLDEYEFLIPNKNFGISRPTFLDARCDSTVVGLSPSEIEEELTHFRTTFSKQIEILEKAFGQDKISIKWGMILWAS